MGLFTDKAADQEIEHLKPLLKPITGKWNAGPGSLWDVPSEFNAENYANCCLLADKVWSSLPGLPGPFKRLGAFAVLAQDFPPFSLADGTEEPDPQALWRPRLAVWALPYFALAISINQEPAGRVRFHLPTPHFQLEFLALLRGMAYGAALAPSGPQTFDTTQLLERSLSVGLIIEGACYAGDQARENGLIGNSLRCLEGLDQLHRDDLNFNNDEFLDRAASWGIED